MRLQRFSLHSQFHSLFTRNQHLFLCAKQAGRSWILSFCGRFAPWSKWCNAPRTTNPLTPSIFIPSSLLWKLTYNARFCRHSSLHAMVLWETQRLSSILKQGLTKVHCKTSSLLLKPQRAKHTLFWFWNVIASSLLCAGYGFVRFGAEDECQRALTEMNGVLCGSRPMRISTAMPKPRAAVPSAAPSSPTSV